MSDALGMRLESLDLMKKASEHDFEGSYAILALAASNLKIAAAFWEFNHLLDAIATDYRKIWEQNSGEPKTNGREK